MRRVVILILVAVAAAGCGTGQNTERIVRNDVEQVARVLPTPRGLTFETSTVRRADAEAVQRVYAGGIADPAAAERYRDIGFRDAAIRTWSGPGGARLTMVVSRWGDHQTATNTGGGAAEVLPLRSGAEAWTPSEIPGARGSRNLDAEPERRALSHSVGDVGLFLAAVGPVDDAAMIRTMELAIRSLDLGP